MPEAATPERLASLADPDILRLRHQHPEIPVLVFREGECLIEEGGTTREVFLVVQGAVVVEQGAEPARTVLALLEAREGHPLILGEMAWFGDMPRTATVRSSGATTALRLEPEYLDAILEGHPALTARLCSQFTERLKETSEALRALQARFRLMPQRRMAQDGEELFRAGAPATELMQLLGGEVDLDGQVVGSESLPGGFLDLEPYLAGGRHRSTARARGMAFLAVLGQDRKEAVVRTFPEVVLALLSARRA